MSSSWRTSRAVRWSSATRLGSYPAACGEDYRHTPFNVRAGLPAHVPLPGVHRVAAIAKRWLLGTHQGAVEADHRQAYLNEFCFRFRRHSRCARVALLPPDAPCRRRATAHLPASRGEPPAQAASPHRTARARPQPGTLALPPAGRPWRQRLQHWSEPGAVRWIPRFMNLLTSKWVEVSEPAQLARCLQPICHRVTTID